MNCEIQEAHTDMVIVTDELLHARVLTSLYEEAREALRRREQLAELADFLLAAPPRHDTVEQPCVVTREIPRVHLVQTLELPAVRASYPSKGWIIAAALGVAANLALVLMH